MFRCCTMALRVLCLAPSIILVACTVLADDWSAALEHSEFSKARTVAGAAAAGTKAIFGGGAYMGGPGISTVDIYDTATNTWSTASLSQAADG